MSDSENNSNVIVISTAFDRRGPQGFQGNQGFQGFQGFQGVQGVPGIAAEIGFQGPQGLQGFQGVQGDRGFQGFQGVQGFQGSIGFQGLQGFQGFQGFQGIPGVAAEIGFQGPQGFQGNQGFQGFQGFQGPATTIENIFSAVRTDISPQNITAGVTTVVDFDVPVVANANYNTITGVFTVPVAGTYEFEYGIRCNISVFPIASRAQFNSFINVNGGSTPFTSVDVVFNPNSLPSSNPSPFFTQNGDATITLAAGDQVTISVRLLVVVGQATGIIVAGWFRGAQLS